MGLPNCFRVFGLLVLGWVVAWVVALPCGALPDVADHTPADAEVVLLVPSLSGLNAQLGGFASASGIGQGELEDAVGIFKRELGLVEGVDDDGAMMIALSGVAEALRSDGTPRVYMVLPVSDYALLLKSLSGEPGEQTSVSLPGGYTGVMKQAGDHAIIAADAAMLSAYRPGGRNAPLLESAGERGAALIDRAGLAVVIDTAALRADVAEPMTKLAISLLGEIDALLAFDVDPAGWQPMMSALTKTLVEGSDIAVLSVTMSDRGLTYREAYKPKADSDLAAMLPGKPAGAGTDTVLAALAHKPIVAAFAADTAGVDVAALADRMGGLIGLDPVHALGASKEHLAAALEGVDSVAWAYYTLPASSDQLLSHWFNTAAVLTGDDPKAIASQFKTFITQLNGAQLPLAAGGHLKLVALYESNVRELDGQVIDTFTVRAQIPEEAQTSPMVQALAALAAGGFTGHLVATDQHVLITTTDDDPATRALIAALNQPTGLGLAEPIASLRDKELADRNTLQAYFSLRGVAQSLNPLFQMIGGIDAIETDPDLPPIGLAIDASDGWVVAAAHVPAKVIALLKDQGFDLAANSAETSR